MGNASNVYGGEQPLALFEQLSALNGASAGAWTDCATRLEIAADRAAFEGQRGRARGYRDRADECRANAIRAARQAVR